MRTTIEDVAERDHSNCDCLIVSILTHGEEGKLYGTDGDEIPSKYFEQCLYGDKCPTLAGKPKVTTEEKFM